MVYAFIVTLGSGLGPLCFLVLIDDLQLQNINY